MSMAQIYNVPGKVRAVLERLTAARAANLDNLNATISSRAPASTAVSTANLTNQRIAALDDIAAILEDTNEVQGDVNTLVARPSPLQSVVAKSYYSEISTTSASANFVLGASFNRAKTIVQGSCNDEVDGESIRFQWQSDSFVTVGFTGPAPVGSRTFALTVIEFA